MAGRLDNTQPAPVVGSGAGVSPSPHQCGAIGIGSSYKWLGESLLRYHQFQGLSTNLIIPTVVQGNRLGNPEHLAMQSCDESLWTYFRTHRT
jgi:hypothetical protein